MLGPSFSREILFLGAPQPDRPGIQHLGIYRAVRVLALRDLHEPVIIFLMGKTRTSLGGSWEGRSKTDYSSMNHTSRTRSIDTLVPSGLNRWIRKMEDLNAQIISIVGHGWGLTDPRLIS